MNRRTGDHRWDTAARVLIACALAFALVRGFVVGGFHDVSDVQLIVLSVMIGALLRLDLTPILRVAERLVPWGRSAPAPPLPPPSGDGRAWDEEHEDPPPRAPR